MLDNLMTHLTTYIELSQQKVQLLKELRRCIWIKYELNDNDMTSNVSTKVCAGGYIELRSGDNVIVKHIHDFKIEDIRLNLSNNQKQQLVSQRKWQDQLELKKELGL